jgi:arylsulfatase A-like enzyme
LEYAHQALGLQFQQTALIGAWDGFNTAAASRPDAFLMVGVHDSVPAPWSTPEIDRIAELRANVMGLWEEGSDQWLTWAIAREYLAAREPRILWLALGNTDDWAHADRYDRYLEALHQQDRILGDLWKLLQSHKAYRDKTTLLVTTDHGRGRSADWAEHDVGIPGSRDIWFFAIGPDTPATGEVTTPGEAFQGQLARTLVAAAGLDPDTWDSDALSPFTGAIE